jgi:hypothetical protein
MKYEEVVVAVRTAEVAVRKEENRTDFPWPIDKRSLYKSFDLEHRMES